MGSFINQNPAEIVYATKRMGGGDLAKGGKNGLGKIFPAGKRPRPIFPRGKKGLGNFSPWKNWPGKKIDCYTGRQCQTDIQESWLSYLALNIICSSTALRSTTTGSKFSIFGPWSVIYLVKFS